MWERMAWLPTMALKPRLEVTVSPKQRHQWPQKGFMSSKNVLNFFYFLDILDNRSGAACCTGDGDTLLRFCPSFLAVEMMHQGTVPKKACEEVVRRVWQGVGTLDLEMGIIAMNIKVNVKGYKNNQSVEYCEL